MNKVVQNVNDFINNYHIDKKQKCLLAFSGGYDSMCLLHILHKLELNITAIHLNHNWRGEESKKEEINCRKFCERLGIEFYSEILSDEIPHTETAARDARYAFFERCADKFKSDVIFTAHNANDNAETVLYRITKGTGTDGLCGISPVRGIYYRPLLTTLRADIEEYCLINKLSPNKDSSNSDTKFARNNIRHNILPLLERINPYIINSINSLSDIAREDYEYFDSAAKNIDGNTEKYLLSAAPVQNRYIKQLLIHNNIDYSKEKITYIKDFIAQNAKQKSGKTMSLSNELQLYVNIGTIKVISQNKEKNSNLLHITTEGYYEFGNKNISIMTCSDIPDKYPPDSEYTAYVELDEIDFDIRTRRDGDIITPIGLNGQQKLKKYLNEKKIPQYKKDSLIFLCKDNEIFWAPGLGLSDKIKVKDKVTHIMKISERAIYEQQN